MDRWNYSPPEIGCLVERKSGDWRVGDVIVKADQECPNAKPERLQSLIRIRLGLRRYYGGCHRYYGPCPPCHGNCRDDYDCRGTLKCHMYDGRLPKDCTGSMTAGTNYCYQP